MVLALLGSGVSAVDPSRAFLSSAFKLSSADLARVDAGQVVARTLEAKNRREVATFGIVRIKASPALYVERMADIVTFKRNEDVLQIGTFGTPAQVDDLARLTVDEADLHRLRDCRVGDCDVKLSAEAIDRFRKEIDWRAQDSPQRATGLLRQVLVDYVTRYRTAGNAAAMVYANTSRPLNTASEFASLAQEEAVAWQHVPTLRQHLFEFPVTSKERSTDFVYWSKERVNGRPVLSITHVATVRLDDGAPVRYAIASRQIYAMHYYDASLGITLLVPDTSTTSPAMFVLYLNRSRVDLFDGLFGGMARKIVAGRARSLVAELLGRLQKSMETPRQP